MSKKTPRCYSCRDGGTANLDDDVRKTTVVEPWNDGPPVTGFLCGEHRQAAEDDGMIVRS